MLQAGSIQVTKLILGASTDGTPVAPLLGGVLVYSGCFGPLSLAFLSRKPWKTMLNSSEILQLEPK